MAKHSVNMQSVARQASRKDNGGLYSFRAPLFKRPTPPEVPRPSFLTPTRLLSDSNASDDATRDYERVAMFLGSSQSCAVNVRR